MTDAPKPAAPPSIDLVTAAAIAAIVGIVSTQLHEAGGHGGACLALGRHLTTWGAFYVDCDTHAAPAWVGRAIAAAGSSVNLLAGLVAYALFRMTPASAGLLRWTWWFAFVLNGMVWAGYYAFSGIADIGDWGTEGVLAGVANPLPWRIGFAIGGFALYWFWVRWAMAELAALTGRDDEGRRRLRRLSLTAYLTNGVVAVAVGLLNPVGVYIVIASAAASSFGGASGLLWGPRYLRAGPAVEAPLAFARNWLVIAAAIVLVLADALVLGPSLKL